MKNNDFIEVLEDCNAHLIPSGDAIKLKKGTRAKITQSLGGDFTLYVNGNLVKKLISQYHEPGKNIVQWNSTNNQGQSVSAGVYYYRIIVGNNSQTNKMLLLK